MPPEAKLCIIEDNRFVLESTRELLEVFGRHKTVLTATTLPEALGVIPLFRERGVQIALVDGNLSKGDISGNDGKIVTAAINAQAPEVIVVGTSASGFVEGAHLNLNRRATPEELIELITKL